MNISGLVDNIESQEPAGSIGATSLSYVVRVEEKQYFMKQLRPEYASELRYRAAFYKEYETGRRIGNRHILYYESIGENLSFYLPLLCSDVTLTQRQPYLCTTARLPLCSGK